LFFIIDNLISLDHLFIVPNHGDQTAKDEDKTKCNKNGYTGPVDGWWLVGIEFKVINYCSIHTVKMLIKNLIFCNCHYTISSYGGLRCSEVEGGIWIILKVGISGSSFDHVDGVPGIFEEVFIEEELILYFALVDWILSFI